MCDLSVVIFHLLLWKKKKAIHRKQSTALSKRISENSIGDEVVIQKKDNGKMTWEVIFFSSMFLPSAFQRWCAHLSFLFTFKSMMDACRIILKHQFIELLFSSLAALLWQQKKIWLHREECWSQFRAKWTLWPVSFLKAWNLGFFGGKKAVYVLHHSPPLLDRLPSSVTVEAISNSVLWYALHSWKIILFNAICKRLHTRGLILVDLENNYVNFPIHRIILHFKNSWTFKLLELHSVHSFYLNIINYVLFLLSLFSLENKSVAHA